MRVLQRLAGCALGSALVCVASRGSAGASDAAQPRASEPFTPHARVGAGVMPVLFDDGDLPKAHHGFGGFVAAFLQLPFQLSAGIGADFEHYRYDSANFGDDANGPPRYEDEGLDYVRLLGLVQYDFLPRGISNPFVFGLAGYQREHHELTRLQCRPKQISGVMFGAGAGVEFAIAELARVGVEYRYATQPDTTVGCTLAFIPGEPRGAPHDFFPMRIALTLSVRGL